MSRARGQGQRRAWLRLWASVGPERSGRSGVSAPDLVLYNGTIPYQMVKPRWRSGSASHLYMKVNAKVTRSTRVRGIHFASVVFLPLGEAHQILTCLSIFGIVHAFYLASPIVLLL